MHILLFLIHLFVGIFYTSVSVPFFFIEKRFAPGLISLTAGLIILGQLVSALSPKKKVVPFRWKKTETHKLIFSAIRWSLGAIFIAAAMGSFLTDENFPAWGLTLTGLVFISRIDNMIFNQPESTTGEIVARNIGTAMALISIGLFIEKHNWWGLGLLIIGLIVMLLSMPTDQTVKPPVLKTEAPSLWLKTALRTPVSPDTPPQTEVKTPVQPRPQRQPFAAEKIYPYPSRISKEKKEGISRIVQTLLAAKEEKSTIIPTPKKEIPTAIPSSLATLKEEFNALALLAAQKRGYAFQHFLSSLFSHYNLSPRMAFRLTGEEIDGSFEMDTHIYLLEAKWQAKPCGQADILVFNGKVEGKSTWARGIFISYNGFSKEGLEAFSRGKRTSIIGMDSNDLLYILDGNISLTDAIRKKARHAGETNDFFKPITQLV